MIDELAQWLQDDEALPRTSFSHWPQQAIDHLVSSGVLYSNGFLNSVFCTACHLGHYAQLKPHIKGRRYFCRAVGWVYPDLDTTIAYRMDMLAFARILGASIGLPARRIQIKSENRLVLLGDLSCGGSLRTLFLARQAETAREISELAGFIDAAGSKNTGLVLCAGDAPTSVRTRHRHQFFPLHDALELYGPTFRLDQRQLAAWVRDLERTRARASDATDAAADWVPDAIEAWKRLNAKKRLGTNASLMGRLVRQELIIKGYSEDEAPQPKAISDKLRDLHRRHYRRREGRRKPT